MAVHIVKRRGLRRLVIDIRCWKSGGNPRAVPATTLKSRPWLPLRQRTAADWRPSSDRIARIGPESIGVSREPLAARHQAAPVRTRFLKGSHHVPEGCGPLPPYLCASSPKSPHVFGYRRVLKNVLDTHARGSQSHSRGVGSRTSCRLHVGGRRRPSGRRHPRGFAGVMSTSKRSSSSCDAPSAAGEVAASKAAHERIVPLVEKELFRRGAPAFAVAALAGHAELETTRKHAHGVAVDLRRAISVLNPPVGQRPLKTVESPSRTCEVSQSSQQVTPP